MDTSDSHALRRWVLACIVAETIGMTAAATAARVGHDLVEDGGARLLALGLVVAGGLVEGVALGVLQGRVLATRWPHLHLGRFVALTVLVAGVGWAVASAPSALATDDGGSGPALGLILLGALGIGLVMGPVLGAAQTVALHGVVGHPRRWVAANTVAWPAAMVVIFAGASTAGSAWETPVVAAYGALTGAFAGATLGLLTGPWLDSLDGQPLVNRAVLALVGRKRLGLHRRLVGLRVRGRRTGRVLTFPVQYAVTGDDLVVVPGHADRKTWWRNLRSPGTQVEVLIAGRWVSASAELVTAGEHGYEEAVAAYRHRWQHAGPNVWEPIIVLHCVGRGIPASSRGLESVG